MTKDELRIEAEKWLDTQIELRKKMAETKYLEVQEGENEEDVREIVSNMESYDIMDKQEDGSYRRYNSFHVSDASELAEILGIKTQRIEREGPCYPIEIRFSYKNWIVFSLSEK